jgi:acid phosphatase (class A)
MPRHALPTAALASLLLAASAPTGPLRADALAGAAVACVPARDGAVDVCPLDLRRILPPPPANDSAETRAELDELLRIQAQRTPQQAARARADARVSWQQFAEALGSSPTQLAPGRLPEVDALFRSVTSAESAWVGPGKDAFARPRPYWLEPRLEPLLDRTRQAAYPSGHSTWAYATALVLADMVPERRAALLARAQEYAHDRVVAGMHFPSDVEAGRLTGTVLAAQLFLSAHFQSAEATAALELRKALGLPAS